MLIIKTFGSVVKYETSTYACLYFFFQTGPFRTEQKWRHEVYKFIYPLILLTILIVTFFTFFFSLFNWFFLKNKLDQIEKVKSLWIYEWVDLTLRVSFSV